MSRNPNGRTADGKFAPGWQGGPGRPPAAKEADYLCALRQAVDLQEWEKAILAILLKAQQGSVRHFEVLAKFLLPVPVQRVQLAAAEERANEFRVAGQSPDDVHREMLDFIRQEMVATNQREALFRGEPIIVDGSLADPEETAKP